jgi:nicotinamidase-related amidase
LTRARARALLGGSAFYGTELDLQLRRRHVTGIVLAGVATSIGVDTTARAAHERAYNVTFGCSSHRDARARRRGEGFGLSAMTFARTVTSAWNVAATSAHASSKRSLWSQIA